jgi:hypothetical protein
MNDHEPERIWKEEVVAYEGTVLPFASRHCQKTTKSFNQES